MSRSVNSVRELTSNELDLVGGGVSIGGGVSVSGHLGLGGVGKLGNQIIGDLNGILKSVEKGVGGLLGGISASGSVSVG